MTIAAPVVLCSLNARYVHTSLAIRQLAAYVRSQWPQAPRTELLEWTINDQELPIVQRLFSRKAAVYGFSCYIWNITLVRRVCRDLKKLLPQALIVWGGPEAGCAAAEWLTSEPSVDMIIRGEGEKAWLALLQALDTTDLQPDLSGVPNLSWRQSGSGLLRENPDGPLLEAADWPFPYSAGDLAGLRDRIVYYETSRGCPFQCSYCLSALDRSVRHRPLELVFREIDQLMAAGLQQVKLVDRTFNCLTDRARKIWQYIIDHADKAGRTNFHFEVAGDLLDDQTTDILNEAPPGLIQLEIGVQTIQPDVLAAIGRTSRLDSLARQVERLRRGGRVHLHLDLIAGLPGENLARFGESFDWVWRLRPQQLQLGFLKVLAGSPMAEQARDRGFLWQDEPPYEILKSDCLDFDDLIRLKGMAWILDIYQNSGFCDQALGWLAGRAERPWQFFDGLASWATAAGLDGRPLNPADRCRLLIDYASATDTELAGDGWISIGWRDLLRLEYQLGGQKDQPPWLMFYGTEWPSADQALLDRARSYFRARHPDAGRMRVDLLHFDLDVWQQKGELSPGRWLTCLEMSGSRPSMLDNCRENDLY